jgi:hypothetical protein
MFIGVDFKNLIIHPRVLCCVVEEKRVGYAAVEIKGLGGNEMKFDEA